MTRPSDPRTASDGTPAPADIGPAVADPVWRRRLLIVDGILIAVLGWLLWSVASGREAWDQAEAERRAEQDETNLRGYRIEADEAPIDSDGAPTDSN